MSLPAYAIGEVFRSVRRRPLTTISSIFALTLLLFLVEFFWVASLTLSSAIQGAVARMQIELFIEESLNDAGIESIQTSLRSVSEVRDITFISREAAREELIRLIGTDLRTDSAMPNQLPRSIRLSLKEGITSSREMERIVGRLSNLSGVDTVLYSRAWLERMDTTVESTRRVGRSLGLAMLLAALINLALGIQLIAQSGSIGLKQARLLGAGRLFLGFPFILEGTLIALLSAALSWGLLFNLQHFMGAGLTEYQFPSFTEIGYFCLACAGIGAVSGYIGVRRHLR